MIIGPIPAPQVPSKTEDVESDALEFSAELKIGFNPVGIVWIFNPPRTGSPPVTSRIVITKVRGFFQSPK